MRLLSSVFFASFAVFVGCGAHDNGEQTGSGGTPGSHDAAPRGGSNTTAAGRGGSSTTATGAGGGAPVGTAGAADVGEPGSPGEPELPDVKVKAYVDGELGCHALAEVQDQPFVADPAASTLPLAQALARVKGRYEGSWVGVAEAPTGWLPQRWITWLQIQPDQTYTAKAAADGGYVPPFYYGDTEACPPQRVVLDGLGDAGVEGEIDIAFRYEDKCKPPAWQGTLKALNVDADGVRLRFDFATSTGYGPVRYDLFRACD